MTKTHLVIAFLVKQIKENNSKPIKPLFYNDRGFDRLKHLIKLTKNK